MRRNPPDATYGRGLALAVMAFLALPPSGEAQILRKARETVKRAAEAETLSQLDRMVRGRVRCVFDDLDCIRRAEESGEEVVLTDDSGEILDRKSVV